MTKFREEKEFRSKFRLHKISAEILGRKGISANRNQNQKSSFRFRSNRNRNANFNFGLFLSKIHLLCSLRGAILHLVPVIYATTPNPWESLFVELIKKLRRMLGSWTELGTAQPQIVCPLIFLLQCLSFKEGMLQSISLFQ